MRHHFLLNYYLTFNFLIHSFSRYFIEFDHFVQSSYLRMNTIRFFPNLKILHRLILLFSHFNSNFYSFLLEIKNYSSNSLQYYLCFCKFLDFHLFNVGFLFFPMILYSIEKYHYLEQELEIQMMHELLSFEKHSLILVKV